MVWSSIAPACKIIHISFLRWNSLTRSQYARRFPLDPIPQTTFITTDGYAPPHPPGASLTELFLNIHAFILVGLVCGVYQVKNKYRHTQNIDIQEFSVFSQISCYLLGIFALVLAICSVWYYPHIDNGYWGINWLDVVYLFDVVGEGANWFRFTPQIPVNFLCQSATGLSPRLLYIEFFSTIILGASQISKAIHYKSAFQITQPVSIFFLIIFKLLILSKLVQQHLFVYRHNEHKVHPKKNEYERIGDPSVNEEIDEEALLDPSANELSVLTRPNNDP